MIHTTDEARRLARALVQDLVLYGALDDAAALAEGRALFASRVDPSMQPFFEEELEAARQRPPSPTAAHRPADPRPAEPRPVGEGTGGVIVMGALILLLLLGGAAYVLIAR